MKVFITTAPQQPEGQLKKVVYQPVEREILRYDHETRFPIIPVINAFAEEGEEIRILSIVQDLDSCRRNQDIFEEEVAELCTAKSVGFTVERLEVSDANSVKELLNVLQKLMDKLSDGDDLHACITYGSKPIPIVILEALRYARTALKNTFVSCVVYGAFNWDTKITCLYDVTALIRADDLIRNLVDCEVPDVKDVFREILAL